MELDRHSWLFDSYGNEIIRWVDDSVTVTMHPRSPLTRDQVIAWYWAKVGVRQAQHGEA